MRTDDILALGNHPRAEHRRAVERRSPVIGAILAALFTGIVLVKALLPAAQAYVLPNVSKDVERGGTLSSLKIVF